MIADKDLISIQQARILAENANEAKKKLAQLTQDELDKIIQAVITDLLPHLDYLATLSYEETDFGTANDKKIKNRFVCEEFYHAIRPLRCVGIIEEDKAQGIVKIGVPMGIIAAFCPVTSPVSTTIYKALLAIKSGNAIIFSPHPRATKSIITALDIVIKAAEQAGLPIGTISYLKTIDKRGSIELMNHPAISLIMMTGVPNLLPYAKEGGKPLIYGGAGNSPTFIERTADINQAVIDIIQSKSFDHGIMASAEQSIVVDACIEKAVEDAFKQHGAYFMSADECDQLAKIFFHMDGRPKKDAVGKSAQNLAQRAGFSIPTNTKVLIAKRTHVSNLDLFSKELLAPALAFYVEDDWQHACEKCIELLITERNAHTLVIHSKDESVIQQFAIKKPVGRLLVNTPATFGGMGLTTHLFPAMTLGSVTTGSGITADNVSPMNLVYTRTVGYGTRKKISGSDYSATAIPNHNELYDEIVRVVHEMLK